MRAAEELQEDWEDINGILHPQGLLFVPEVIETKLISRITTTLYLGFDKTRELIARKYFGVNCSYYLRTRPTKKTLILVLLSRSKAASRWPSNLMTIQREPSARHWCIANLFPPDLWVCVHGFSYWVIWCRQLLVMTNPLPPDLWGYEHGFGYWLSGRLREANPFPPKLWGYVHGFGYWLISQLYIANLFVSDLWGYAHEFEYWLLFATCSKSLSAGPMGLRAWIWLLIGMLAMRAGQISLRQTLRGFEHGFGHQPEEFDSTARSRRRNLSTTSFTCHCWSWTPLGRGGCTNVQMQGTRTLCKRTLAGGLKLGLSASTSTPSSANDHVSLTGPPLWFSGVREVTQASSFERIRLKACQRGTLWQGKKVEGGSSKWSGQMTRYKRVERDTDLRND